MRAFAVVSLMVLISACASPREKLQAELRIERAKLEMQPDVRYDVLVRDVEAIYSVTAGKGGLRFRVSSNGCTTKDNFQATHRLSPFAGFLAPDPLILVTIHRVRPDTCQSFAMGSTYVEFTYAELGAKAGDHFGIENPITAWTGPGE